MGLWGRHGPLYTLYLLSPSPPPPCLFLSLFLSLLTCALLASVTHCLQSFSLHPFSFFPSLYLSLFSVSPSQSCLPLSFPLLCLCVVLILSLALSLLLTQSTLSDSAYFPVSFQFSLSLHLSVSLCVCPPCLFCPLLQMSLHTKCAIFGYAWFCTVSAMHGFAQPSNISSL